MVQAIGNREYLNVRVTDSTDVIDRLLNAPVILEHKGISIVRAMCSRKLFHEIAVKIAPRVGYIEQEQILIGGKRPTNTDTKIDGGVLLEPDDAIIYNMKKPFILIVERNGNKGMMALDYQTNTTV